MLKLKSYYDLPLTDEENVYVAGILSELRNLFPNEKFGQTQLQKIVVHVVKELQLKNVLMFDFRLGTIVPAYCGALELIPSTDEIIREATAKGINFDVAKIDSAIKDAHQIFHTNSSGEVRQIQYKLYDKKLYSVMMCLDSATEISKTTVNDLFALHSLLPKNNDYLLVSEFILECIDFFKLQLEISQKSNAGLPWIRDIIKHIEDINPKYFNNNVQPERLLKRLESETALSQQKIEDDKLSLQAAIDALPSTASGSINPKDANQHELIQEIFEPFVPQ